MLKFATFISDIELPFYTSLASHKINHDKLDDSARRLLGLYEIRPTDLPDASCRLQLHGNALTNDELVVLRDPTIVVQETNKIIQGCQRASIGLKDSLKMLTPLKNIGIWTRGQS